MKALWRHEPYIVIENHDEGIELERMDSDERVLVSFADPLLVIDPTDGDLDEAEAMLNTRGHCCDCPHVTYTTVSVRDSRHVCHVCGDTFTDPQRTKHYVHYRNSHLS